MFGQVRRAKGETTFAPAVTAVNLGSFLFRVMLARTLDPGLLGQVVALVSLLVLFQVPANACEVLVARAVRTTQPGEDSKIASVGHMLSASVVVGTLLAGAILGASPLVRSWLHLPSLTTAMLLGVYAIPVAISTIPKGVMFGEGRYGGLALALMAGSATQLILGTALVHTGHGAQGALAGIAAGEVVTSMALVAAMRHRWTVTAPGPATSLRVRDAAGPVIAYLGLWLLSVVDVVLVQHFRPGAMAGSYAAASTAAQIAIFAPEAIAASVFIKISGGNPAGTRAHLLLLRAAAIVTVVVAATTVLVSVVGVALVKLLYGGGFPTAAPILAILAASGGCIGLASLLLQNLLAAERRLAVVPCALGCMALVTGLSLHHDSLQVVAVWTLGATASAAAALLILSLVSLRMPESPVVQDASLALLDADLDLTIVVPYYNPGELLAGNIARLIDALDASHSTFEVIAVSDGSTDGSERHIDAITDERLVRVALPLNQGKGTALRIGLARGRGKWLGFIDADGDLDPFLFEPFIVLTHLYSPEIILGSKWHPLSEVDYPAVRRFYSHGFRKLAHLLFSLDVSDTQTGIKLIRRDVLAAVLPRMLEKRFAFDLELFVVARRLGYRRFLEAPVRLRHQLVSTVSIRSVRRTLWDTLGIFYRLRVVRTYDQRKPIARPEDFRHLGARTLQRDIITRRGVARDISSTRQ